MTVPTETNKVIGTGNGVAPVFPFTFGTLPSGDLVVTLYDLDDVAIPQIENTDYTVLGKGAEDGGSVVFVVPPPDGWTVLIRRILPTTQPDDLKNQGSYYPRTVERMFDRRAMVDQQLEETLDRTLTLPPQVQGVSTELPSPMPLNLIGWDATGIELRNFTVSDIGTTLAFSNFVADTFTATPGQTLFTLSSDPGALANLDVSIDGVTQVPTVDYTYLGTTLTFITPMAGGEKVLARYGTALPTGITLADQVAYTPPSTGILGTIRSFLDSLWATGTNAGAKLIRWIQAGSGAVPRTVEAKLRERVSVLDFGADPTGVLDSSTAFANAAAAVGTDGQVVVPEGNYLITAVGIGSSTTSWDKLGTVTFTGGGSLTSPDGDGIRRFHNWTRFGNGIGTGQFVDFNDPDDNTRAHFYSLIGRAAQNDRAGNMYLQFENTSDIACTSQMIAAWHRGQNTNGFPNAQTLYSTATKLKGASVLANFMAVLSPANDLPGAEWTGGLCYAQEINFGNRWAELGLQRDPTLNKWVGGQIIAPDVLQGPDGGGTGYAFHAQYGTVYGNANNGGPVRGIWIPICIKQDTMPAGGIGFHPRGSTSAAPGTRPLAIIEAALNWDWGIDLGKADITNAAFRGKNLHITGAGDITHGVFRNNAPGEVVIESNVNAEIGGGTRSFVFRKEGRFGIPSNPPASAGAAGNAGDITWDSNFIYVCVAPSTWKRVAIASW